MRYRYLAYTSAPRVLVAVGKFLGNGDLVLAEKILRYIRAQGIRGYMVVFSSRNMPEVHAAIRQHLPSLIVYCCSFADSREAVQIPSVAICEYDFSGYCQPRAADVVYPLGLSFFGIMPPLESYNSRLSALRAVQDKRLRSVFDDGNHASFLAHNSLFMCYSHYASDLVLYFFLGTAYLERCNSQDICIMAPPMDAWFMSKLAILDDALKNYGVATRVLIQISDNGEFVSHVETLSETGKLLRIVTAKVGLEDHERLTFAAATFAMSTGDQHSGICLFWGKLMLYELFPHKANYWANMDDMACQVAPHKSNLIKDIFAFSKSFCRFISKNASVTHGLSETAAQEDELSSFPEPASLRILCSILDQIDDFPGKKIGDYVATHKSADKYFLPLLQKLGSPSEG